MSCVSNEVLYVLFCNGLIYILRSTFVVARSGVSLVPGHILSESVWVHQFIDEICAGLPFFVMFSDWFQDHGDISLTKKSKLLSQKSNHLIGSTLS